MQLGTQREECAVLDSQTGSPSGANIQVGQKGGLGRSCFQGGLLYHEKPLPFSHLNIIISLSSVIWKTSGSMASVNLGAFVHSFSQWLPMPPLCQGPCLVQRIQLVNHNKVYEVPALCWTWATGQTQNHLLLPDLQVCFPRGPLCLRNQAPST